MISKDSWFENSCRAVLRGFEWRRGGFRTSIYMEFESDGISVILVILKVGYCVDCVPFAQARTH